MPLLPGAPLRLHPGKSKKRHALHRRNQRSGPSRVGTDVVDGFTKRYGVHNLVHVEFHFIMTEAILREKGIKKWRRAWKIMLIEEANPDWRDLYDEVLR